MEGSALLSIMVLIPHAIVMVQVFVVIRANVQRRRQPLNRQLQRLTPNVLHWQISVEALDVASIMVDQYATAHQALFHLFAIQALQIQHRRLHLDQRIHQDNQVVQDQRIHLDNQVALDQQIHLDKQVVQDQRIHRDNQVLLELLNLVKRVLTIHARIVVHVTTQATVISATVVRVTQAMIVKKTCKTSMNLMGRF